MKNEYWAGLYIDSAETEQERARRLRQLTAEWRQHLESQGQPMKVSIVKKRRLK